MWRSQVAVWCLLFVMATPVWAQRPGGDGGGAGVDMATVMFASLAAAALALLGCLWWLRRHYAAMDARAQAKEHAVVRRIEVAEAGAAVAMGGCVVEVPRTSTQQRAFVLAQWTSVHPPMLTPPFDDTPAKQQAKPPRLMRTVAFPVNTWRKRQTLIRKVSPADFKVCVCVCVCVARCCVGGVRHLCGHRLWPRHSALERRPCQECAGVTLPLSSPRCCGMCVCAPCDLTCCCHDAWRSRCCGLVCATHAARSIGETALVARFPG